MTPVTALALILGGLSLLLAVKEHWGSGAHRPSRAIALVIALLGLLELGAGLTGRDIGIDGWLFGSRLGTAAGHPVPNRMAPSTALTIVLIGLGLTFLDRETAHGRRPSQYLTLTAAAIALFAMIGADPFSAGPSFNPMAMALPTALSFSLLSLGILGIRPDRGLMAVISSQGAGGTMARRLLPAAVLLPALLGGIRWAGERAGFDISQFGLSGLVASHIVLFAGFIGWNASLLHHLDSDRLRTEDELRLAHDELEVRVWERTAELARANGALLSEIAARKRADAALVREQEFQRAVLNNLSDRIVACDAEGVLSLFNRASEESHGQPAERLTAERWAAHYGLFLADKSRLLEREEIPLYRAWRGETVRDAEIVLSPTDETTRTFLASGQPFFDAHGTILGAVVVMCDITERKRADATLRESEERFRSVFEHAAIGMALMTATGRYLRVNRAFSEITGYAEQELQALDLFAITHPDDREESLRSLQSIREGAANRFVAVRRFLRKGGGVVWVQNSVSFVKDGQGRTANIIALCEDITERKRAEQEIRLLNAQLELRLSRLNALRRIDLAITASHDLGEILTTLVEQVTSQLRVDAAAILLLDSHVETLGYVAASGFASDRITGTSLRRGEGYAGHAAPGHHLVNVPDLRQSSHEFVLTPLLEGEGFVAYYAVPLVANGLVKGVLEVFHRAPLAPDSEWLGFLEALAAQAAIAIDGATLFDDLQRTHNELTLAYDATIEGWSRAMDLRDKETEGHTRRVTVMALRLARLMGMSEADLVHLRRGALLHDIGKMGIPDEVLLKPGPLTDEEWQVMRRHPGYAHEWLAPIPYLAPALDIPYAHHEKWDGSGYPRGLKGEQIPLAARVFAVADIWDALRSDRPYRAGWPEERVLEHIQSLSGTHLDPAVVDAFLEVLASSRTEAVDVAPNPA
ncbi:PAS domain S-box protein [Singulisphaera sp. GP187]|uniref:PAS domain S-box protein n=1 Tax=Singulisphaera sp. GP187 TaxID=1882752 RepID=UPI0009412FAB|nr:HD domain-containing phosphohydrolase [Singulisphaera sp. GP187]